jgi:hypothetical protein
MEQAPTLRALLDDVARRRDTLARHRVWTVAVAVAVTAGAPLFPAASAPRLARP